MHHQLVPVSNDEEIKPFDALTNLGEVREWLAGNDVDVVLHGHKHIGMLAKETFRTNMPGGLPPIKQILIAATGTIGHGQSRRAELAKLFDFDVKLPTIRRARVTSIPAVSSGVPISLSSLPTAEARLGYDPSATEFSGETLRQVYEQLLAHADGENQHHLGPIVCRVRDASTAGELPASYPSGDALDDAGTQSWFEDMVKLWQSDSRLTSMDFNHGERIFGKTRPNQLQRVIDALASDPTTSRAVIDLLDQTTDDVTEASVKFPAFCMVQFRIEAGRVQAVGYFRKQEMRYWWPINVAELKSLQSRVCAGVAKRGRPAIPGEIVTITAMPTYGSSFPRVAITKVDRLVDENPGRLLRMALCVYNPAIVDAEGAIADWQVLVAECTPPLDAYSAADGYPLPTAGLNALEQLLDGVSSSHESSDLADRIRNSLQTIGVLTENLTSRQVQDERTKFDSLHSKLLRNAEKLSGEISELKNVAAA